VVIGPPPADPDERGGFFRRFGMFIDSLGGNYGVFPLVWCFCCCLCVSIQLLDSTSGFSSILLFSHLLSSSSFFFFPSSILSTISHISLFSMLVAAEDIGVSVSDMVHIRAMTEWVAGIPTEMGGSGNPAPYTAHGVYLGMKQAVLHKHDTDSLSGMRILVEGLGSVGYLLAKKLHNEGAELIVCDVNELKVQKALDKFGCKSVPLDYRFDEKFDMYVICLL
jgi:hypothetical protein